MVEKTHNFKQCSQLKNSRRLEKVTSMRIQSFRVVRRYSRLQVYTILSGLNRYELPNCLLVSLRNVMQISINGAIYPHTLSTVFDNYIPAHLFSFVYQYNVITRFCIDITHNLHELKQHHAN